VRSIYKGAVVVRDTTMLMGGHYLKTDRFEGSQAMPASPSGGGRPFIGLGNTLLLCYTFKNSVRTSLET
jgi:hypothetical protein